MADENNKVEKIEVDKAAFEKLQADLNASQKAEKEATKAKESAEKEAKEATERAESAEKGIVLDKGANPAENPKAEDRKEIVMDSKNMLKNAANNGTKIKYTDRVKLEILKDTKYYKKGQIVSPHKVVADELVKKKVAKKVKEEDDN